MKQKKKIIIILISFMIIMVCILIYFINNFESIQLKNKAKTILNYVYSLEYGEYSYKNGVIYNSSGIVSIDYYINGNGNIYKDEYSNVKFSIETDKYCVSKTSLGKINVYKNKCNSIDNINADISKNNTQVSFSFDKKITEYMISNKNDMKSGWIKINYEENLILYFYEKNNYYIWFKDEEGNISDTINFDIECFNASKSEYNNKMYYCNSSIVIIDGVEWVVLSDNEKEITLLKYLPLDEKLSHCFDYESEYCYYTKENINEYKWSNSYINYYLNNVYINTLSNEIKNNLVSESICDNISGTLGCESNDGCGGYLKSEIENNDYFCSNYTNSKIRLITYLEYKNAFENSSENNNFSGNYWSMNASKSKHGSSVQYNSEYYIMEELTNKLDIKPIVTIEKQL